MRVFGILDTIDTRKWECGKNTVMNRWMLCATVVVIGLCVSAYDKRAPEPVEVPELLVTVKGEKVGTVADWESVRRPELLQTMMNCVYGVRPVERPNDLRFELVGEPEEAYDGQAIKKVVRGSYSGPGGASSFEFAAWIPKCARKVASFVYISPREGRTADDLSVGHRVYTLPARYIISRGYGVIAFRNYEFAEDFYGTSSVSTGGVFKVFGPLDAAKRKPTDWGILSAWAWGASRMVDWIETESLLNARRVGVVGLSRNGKAALWAGATDRRFAMTVSCCSGMCGAKLNHLDCTGSEDARAIMGPAWRWFCPDFAKWIGRDAEMPFDQHWLLALLAPRLLYVSSASEDAWAGPRGEFASSVLATPAWNIYGKAGLIQHGFPNPDVVLAAGNVGYHLRPGFHDITPYDWQRYLDFADGHGWNL